MEVAAGDRHGAAADHHPRAGHDATLDRVAQGRSDMAQRAVLADGRHARLERRSGVRGGTQENDVGAVGHDVIAGCPISDPAHVRVAVDQARQDRRVAIAVGHGARAVGRADLGPRADRADGRAVEQHGSILERSRAGPVEEACCGQDGELGQIGHGCAA
jgi:hypothetical protein